MQITRSQDGTPLAFERQDTGPALVLVGGALNDRTTFAALTERLADRYTVFSYDRRGRGDSGDQPTYAVAREIDDLAAVVTRAGGSAYAFGVSSAAVLAAEAAAQGVPITGLALIEPPFILGRTRPPIPRGFAERLTELVTAGHRGDAVELFLTAAIEMPAEVVAPMRDAPLWTDLEMIAHTLRYDLAVLGDFSVPPHWSAAITVPTLVIVGGPSATWRELAGRTVADALPRGRLLTLDGHPHDASPDVLATTLAEFFTARTVHSGVEL